MKLLLVSLDRKAFDAGDPARERLAALAGAFEELHVIVYARKSLGLERTRIAENAWLHPTASAGRFSYIPDAIRLGTALARTGRPDLVSGQDLGETGIAAWRIAKRLRVPLQLQDHADVFDPEFAREGAGNRVRALVGSWLVGKADCLRSVHPAAAARIARRFPALAPRIAVLPVFVDLARFGEPGPVAAVRERYPRFRRIALMASRLVPQKDIGFALRAFADAAVPDAGLVVLGEGPLRERLEGEARALGIGDRVAFAPWEPDLAPWYRAADLFLLSSRYESYGRTLVEAAAAGLPFVSTDVGVARMLADAGAGTVVALDDAKGFATAIAAGFASPPARQDRATPAIAPLTGTSMAAYRERFRASLERCAPRV